MERDEERYVRMVPASVCLYSLVHDRRAVMSTVDLGSYIP